jgi:hypothetical protein
MGPRAAGLRLLRGLPALVALGVGCGVLVDGSLDSVHCSAEGVVGPPACPEGAQCRDGACVDVGTATPELGAPCDSDRDCGALDFCLDPALFGGDGPSICARPCCSSSDCEPRSDALCWIPDEGGGGFCRLGRDVGRPEVGALPAGARCVASGDCRSGLCIDDACADACCSDTNCAGAEASCQLTTGVVASGAAWACQPVDPDKAGYFEPCREDDDCASGLCAMFEDVGRRCTIPCCGSDMCPNAIVDDERVNVGCTEWTAGDGSMVRACTALRRESGISAVGVPCSQDRECMGGMCIPSPGQAEGLCSDVCCTEASCGDVALFGCRPYPTGSSWALRCAPK